MDSTHQDKFQFNITGTAIPTITKTLVKTLGKVFDRYLILIAAGPQQLGVLMSGGGRRGRGKREVGENRRSPGHLRVSYHSQPAANVRSSERKRASNKSRVGQTRHLAWYLSNVAELEEPYHIWSDACECSDLKTAVTPLALGKSRVTHTLFWFRLYIFFFKFCIVEHFVL